MIAIILKNRGEKYRLWCLKNGAFDTRRNFTPSSAFLKLGQTNDGQGN